MLNLVGVVECGGCSVSVCVGGCKLPGDPIVLTSSTTCAA